MVQQQNQFYPQYPSHCQPCQRNFLNGKYVNNENDIFPAEIPMDGSISYFPSNDGNMIFTKAWDNTGKIVTRIYKEISSIDNSQFDVDSLSNALADLNERVLKLEQRQHHAPNNQKNRKDGGMNA